MIRTIAQYKTKTKAYCTNIDYGRVLVARIEQTAEPHLKHVARAQASSSKLVNLLVRLANNSLRVGPDLL